jgi:3-deoxy-manno-octulosonate cytidylyltransferase (CMP-KDO synthetase)
MSIPADIKTRAANTELVVLDVDGVLTDGSLHYDGEGETLKRFHVHDGMGIKLLQDAAIDVAAISGRASDAVDRRMRDLGIVHYFPGTRDKLAALQALVTELCVELDKVCFVGDDIVDLPAMRAVGFAVTVADAHPIVQAAAHWTIDKRGGHGAVRVLADTILDARHGLEQAYERYLTSLRRREEERTHRHTDFGVIIPARYHSSRLPGKPLRELAGKPMVLHVLDNAKSSGAAFVAVATDDERIARCVEEAGGEAWMTSPDHASGTDRLAEVAHRKHLSRDTVVVNVQGDEPLLDPLSIQRIATTLSDHPRAGVATLATPIRTVEQLLDPNVVKVVVEQAGRALSFSRAPIPWMRDLFLPHQPPEALPDEPTFLRHIGLYAYRVAALRRVTAHPPVALEQAEALEQLRMLWLGIPIQVLVVDEEPAQGVDTEDDVPRIDRLLRAREAAR